MHIGIKRQRDLIAQHMPNRFTGGAPYHFADQETECVDVIAVRRAGHPPRCLCCQRIGHRVPIEHRAFWQWITQRRQA